MLQTISEVRTVKGKKPRLPVSFTMPLVDYVAMCEQAAAAGVSLSEWLREAIVRRLAQAEAGNGKR